jgi:hypothetical protein
MYHVFLQMLPEAAHNGDDDGDDDKPKAIFLCPQVLAMFPNS